MTFTNAPKARRRTSPIACPRDQDSERLVNPQLLCAPWSGLTSALGPRHSAPANAHLVTEHERRFLEFCINGIGGGAFFLSGVVRAA